MIKCLWWEDNKYFLTVNYSSIWDECDILMLVKMLSISRFGFLVSGLLKFKQLLHGNNKLKI